MASSSSEGFKNIIEISEYAAKNVEYNTIDEFINAENAKLPEHERYNDDDLKGITKALKQAKEKPERTEDYYTEILYKIEINSKSKLTQAKAFISANMLNESRDFVDIFIQNTVKPFFMFSSDETKNIKQYFKTEKTKHDDSARKERVKRDLNIDSKYNDMYTLHFINNGDERVRVNPHPDKIAKMMLKDEHVITFKDTIFIYRNGFYRAETETMKGRIVDTLNQICKGDNSDGIDRKISDIMAQITTLSRVYEYPFNRDINKLPVENGVIVFNFENKTVELVAHDPDKYKFNYIIPVKFVRDSTNEVIYNIYKEYVDNPETLIQMVAQSLMQAMGHGPYKRAYLIYGKKNSGKTTFMEGIEDFIGIDGFSDVGLDEINARFQIASLEGKLLNLHDDMGYFTMKDTGTIKTLTGRSTHKIERKGVQPYDATLTAVHCMTTNTPAKFDNTVKTDAPFWERWEFLTFKGNFIMNGEFKKKFKEMENKSGMLNRVIDTMLTIGNTGKLLTDIDWYTTRERWMLAGNPLYAMIREIGELDVYDPNSTGKRKGVALLKEELLHALQKWCSSQTDYDARLIPDSVKDLTQLVDACGWDTDAKRYFGKSDERRNCYVLPYKWKKNEDALKYWVNFTDETIKTIQGKI